MAGNRKGFRRKTPPRPSRRSPRIQHLNGENEKKPRPEEIIEISSSYRGTDPVGGDPIGGVNDEHEHQYENAQLRELVKYLASIIASGNNFTQSQLGAGFPLLLSTCLTPKNSCVTRTIDAENILASLSGPSDRLTKSAPSMVTGSSDKPQNLEDMNIVRNFFTKMDGGDNVDHYINKKPIPIFHNDAIKRGLQIPYWMQLSFRPSIDMDLDDLEVVMAAYIFQSENVKEYNVLIRCAWGVGNRKTLRTLIPSTWIDQEVLNLLASKLTHFESKITRHNSAWFMPTTFSQYALERGNKQEKAIHDYKDNFMGKVECLHKIFVPLNDQNTHWYLMVIDVIENNIVILDSLQSEWQNEWRKRYVKKLVSMFIEEMLLDPSFYEHPTTKKQMISDYVIIQPQGLPHQLNGYDCGVWVAKWMSDYVWDDDYHAISVTQTTRMKMAIDLVLNSYNEHKYEVIKAAVEKWRELHMERMQLVKI
ncbi:Ulp1 protease family, C-terminal catalytic domain [Sesbania bispinosa]|nr:Ulp1 protease family, C-terminal catalytic domain [Sesbania bispinosa]